MKRTVSCPTCKGDGWLFVFARAKPGPRSREERARPKFPRVACLACDGTGRVTLRVVDGGR